jgi:putative transposase
MRVMGLEAIRPAPKLSRPDREHGVYPYLLRDVEIVRPNQAWCADITYIRMVRGFLYLVAVMDWFSRYVLSWRLSNTLDASFCVEALREALEIGRPEIFNTDQGAQFTSEEHTGVLRAAGVRISMDGRGRVLDNIFIERLWRSVKYEEVYLHDYDSGEAAYDGLSRYFGFYNTQRPHQGLGYRTPEEVYAAALHR